MRERSKRSHKPPIAGPPGPPKTCWSAGECESQNTELLYARLDWRDERENEADLVLTIMFSTLPIPRGYYVALERVRLHLRIKNGIAPYHGRAFKHNMQPLVPAKLRAETTTTSVVETTDAIGAGIGAGTAGPVASMEARTTSGRGAGRTKSKSVEYRTSMARIGTGGSESEPHWWFQAIEGDAGLEHGLTDERLATIEATNTPLILKATLTSAPSGVLISGSAWKDLPLFKRALVKLFICRYMSLKKPLVSQELRYG